MKMYGGVDVKIHAFPALAVDGSEWLATLRARFVTRKELPVPFRAWAGPKTVLEGVEMRKILPPTGFEL
jgi:hypothetical protein